MNRTTAHIRTVTDEEPVSFARSTSRRSDGRRRLTIGLRLTMCFAAIAILMTGGDAVAVWQIGRVEALSRRSYEADQSSLAIMRMHLDVVTFRETLIRLADAQDGNEFAQQAVILRDTFLRDVIRAQQALNLARDADLDPTILTRLQTVRSALPSQVDFMLDLVKANDWRVVRLRLANQVQSLALSSSSLVEDVDREVAQERTQALESAERARHERFLMLLAVAVLILLISALLGWYTTRAICRPLARLDAGAQALARGDFQYEVEVNGADELSDLGRAFNYAAKQLGERKRAEAALRQAEADLAHIHRVTTMGELTASLAHEIRQPVTAAVNYAVSCSRWLSRAQPDLEQACAAAMKIVENLRCTDNIISRIRFLFHKGTPQREEVDVNEVIREMIVLLRSAANQHLISIRTQIAENLPCVMADRVQLQQVFMNLMLNGIEAMKGMNPPGDLTIRSQAENGRLLFSVSDTGVGLPAENIDQIFKAFYTTKPEGTGMGLAISRSIIEAHGGSLWATPNSGPGATFLFTLPNHVEVGE
jgi:signal transduction histidine kinase